MESLTSCTIRYFKQWYMYLQELCKQTRAGNTSPVMALPTATCVKACSHLSQFESTSISHLREVRDWSGCVPSIHFDRVDTTEQTRSDSENQRKFSRDNPGDKPHPFKRNAAGHAGLVVAVLFRSLSLNNPSQSSSEGTIDEASVKKEPKEAWRSETAAKVRFFTWLKWGGFTSPKVH